MCWPGSKEEVFTVSTFDLTPLFRPSVGFDRMVRLLEAHSLEERSSSYPPYNITMAVAGFREEDLEVATHEGLLIITGIARPEPEGIVYIHKGIAGRALERRFQLPDFKTYGPRCYCRCKEDPFRGFSRGFESFKYNISGDDSCARGPGPGECCP